MVVDFPAPFGPRKPVTIPGRASLVLYVSDPDNYINTNHMQSMVEDPPPRLRAEFARLSTEALALKS